MKKKVIATLIIAALGCTMLAGCGGQTQENGGTQTQNTESQSQEQEDAAVEQNDSQDEVQFEDAVIYDDDLVTISVDKMYLLDDMTGDGSAKVAEIAFKFTNKSDKEIAFFPSFYLGENEVIPVMTGNGGGGNVFPDQGKSSITTYSIYYSTDPESKPVESLDDLYSIDGHFELNITGGDRYDADITLADLK